ncbi:hypothetical protein [Aquimarina sp. SS2-1]|uniref:hypothetical protein n=1 Tax=Aquimarina besae TaxID=3342247 RepID=UPI00367214E3
MNLSEEHIINLKLIYESNGQSMHKLKFIDTFGNPHPQPETIISELIEFDYIEIEDDPSIFFLTTSGYEQVEIINNGLQHYNDVTKEIQVDYFTKSIEKLGIKRFKKIIFIWLIGFGIILTVYSFLNGHTNKRAVNDIEIILTDEMKQDIRKKAKKQRIR